jgi:hypothetical protein
MGVTAGRSVPPSIKQKAKMPTPPAPFAWTCSCNMTNTLLTLKCGACESSETKIRFTAMQKWVKNKTTSPDVDPDTCPIALTYRALNDILHTK